jgi:hypothetical protein
MIVLHILGSGFEAMEIGGTTSLQHRSLVSRFRLVCVGILFTDEIVGVRLCVEEAIYRRFMKVYYPVVF